MNIIEGKPGQNSELIENQEIQVAAKKVKKMLYVGWTHKGSLTVSCYKQMREPVGGIKKIELDCSIEYSIEEIKKLSIEAMLNEFNEKILKNFLVKVANNNQEVFDRFTDLNGTNCKFWEFVNKKLKLKNSQLRLFLLTTTKTNNDEGSKVRPREVFCSKNKLSTSTSSSKSNYGSKLFYSLSKDGSSVMSLKSKDSPARTDNKKPSSSSTSECKSTHGTKLRYAINKNKMSVISVKRKYPPVCNGNENPSMSSTKVSRLHGLLSTSTSEGEENFRVPTIQERDLQFMGIQLSKCAFECVKLAIWNGTEVTVKYLDTTLLKIFLKLQSHLKMNNK
ncbi:uncharacterized protein LOC141534254 [Cotesia typhae]|uniref:uncharacterized protein LOC141534254 n=1 Tax=Cotesia typhae TaxID=2053667 RepID=UPI003D680C9F